MTVIFSPNAQRAIGIILQYLKDNFQKSVQMKFVKQYSKCIKKLSQNPYIGKTEIQLEGLNHQYRSLVINKLNKIVYYIENNTIFISTIWDTRRNPENLINQI